MFIYALDIDALSVDMSIVINGVQAVLKKTNTKYKAQTKINQFVTDGKNSVEVFLSALSDGGMTKRNPEFSMSLVGAEHGRIPGAEAILWHTALPPAQRLTAGTPVSIGSFTFTIANGFGRRLWQQGEIRVLSASTVTDLLAYLSSMWEMLNRKNIEGIVERLRTRNFEMSRASGLDASKTELSFRAFLASRFSDPHWSMEPIDPQNVQILPQAGGRFFFAKTKDGEPVLRGQSGEIPFAMEFGLAWIRGELVAVV